MDRFAEYNRHTEELITYLIDRLDKDDVLAGAAEHPGLRRALTVIHRRENIDDYRRAAHRVVASTGVAQRLWVLLARYHAFSLRVEAGVYRDRDGFDPAWLSAPG